MFIFCSESTLCIIYFKARLVAGCVLVPVNITLAALVAKRFGWLEFKIVGASDKMHCESMY